MKRKPAQGRSGQSEEGVVDTDDAGMGVAQHLLSPGLLVATVIKRQTIGQVSGPV